MKFLDIKEILKEAKAISRPLIFSGTDYGIVTMSTSVPMSLVRFHEHLKPTQSVFSAGGPIVVPKKEKCFRLTALQEDQKSLCWAQTRKRNKRKI